MIAQLLQKLIKEVPEELSVCEFDCPQTKCTVRDRTECALYRQSMLRGCGVTQYNTRIEQTEVPAFEVPAFEVPAFATGNS